MKKTLALLALTLAACNESSTHQPAHPPARQQVDVAKTMAITSDDKVTVLAPAGSTAEGAVAISPVDNRIAIAAGIREPTTNSFFVDVFRSTDGGVTWTAPKPLPLTTTSGRALIGHYDPALAFDRTGAAYLVAMGKLGDILATVVLFKSTDNGATWIGTDVSKTQAGLTDKPWIAVDNSGGPTDGYLHLAWFQSNTLNVAISKDRGATWSTPQRLTGGGAPWISAGPNGRVYASTLVNGTNGLNTVLYRSEDAGATFGPAIPLYVWTPFGGTPTQDLGFHQTASDFSTRATRGNLYLIYPALQPNRSGPVSIFFERSTDEGRTWSEPLRLSAPPELGRDAGLPTLAVDDTTGEVTVSWLDLRDDPSNRSARVYAARSTDGGRAFETAAFTPAFNITSGGFLGHYNQTAARAGRRLAVFSDGAGHLSVARLNFSPVEEPPRTSRRRATTRR